MIGGQFWAACAAHSILLQGLVAFEGPGPSHKMEVLTAAVALGRRGRVGGNILYPDIVFLGRPGCRIIIVNDMSGSNDMLCGRVCRTLKMASV